MSEQFTIERHGHRIEVEFDESLVVVARARLFIDSELVGERSILRESVSTASCATGERRSR